jgi:Lateral organ boundaries (LOB) domain
METAPSPSATERQAAIDSFVFHAKQHAASDPTGGCLKYIHHLENKISSLQNELADSQARLALYQGKQVHSLIDLQINIIKQLNSIWAAVLGHQINITKLVLLI